MDKQKSPANTFVPVKKIIFLVIAIILIFLSPVILLVSLHWWQGFSFRFSLPVYPGAQQKNYSYGYFGADTGKEALYFWTLDSIDRVQVYYQEFALPFQADRYYDNWLITAFGINGSSLVYHDVELKEYYVDGKPEIYCHYTQTYRCVNVQLVNLDTAPPVPFVSDITGMSSSSDKNATPFPLDAPLTKGTLIIYSYFVSDF